MGKGTGKSLKEAMKSWRTASVCLLSFSSGLPLGLVWMAIPDWMRSVGVDIRIVGLLSLAQAPWSFKILWAPLMDRYAPPFWGRRRGWIAIAQLALFVSTLLLAGVGHHPDTPWIVAAYALAIAFFAASQDIAYDAYTVEVLRKEEQGVVVGARVAIYLMAMRIAGGLSIWLAGSISWPLVLVLLSLLYIPMFFITSRAPEPEIQQAPPKSLKEAIWEPFVDFLGRHRALDILGFLILYKLADNLATALLRPFLIDMGYTNADRGIGLTVAASIGTFVSNLFGGVMTNFIGLGRALWLFGGIQAFANLGYILVAKAGGVNRPIMYGATLFENVAIGMATGAFSVLMMRMTQKKFAATQFAFFTVLFALPRILSGPIAGYTVGALGCEASRCSAEVWTSFFWLTIPTAIPGLILLQRFCPLGAREPELMLDEVVHSVKPLSGAGLAIRGIVGGFVGLGIGWGASFLAMSQKSKSISFWDVLIPTDVASWTRLVGIISFALFTGLCLAALSYVRHNRK